MPIKDLLKKPPTSGWLRREVKLPMWMIVSIAILVMVMYGSLLGLRLEYQKLRDNTQQEIKLLETEYQDAQRLYKITKDACERQAEICAGAACG